jgi:integrase
MQSVKTMLKWGVDQGYIPESPLANMKVPTATSRGDEAYLTPEKWAKISQHLVEGHLWDLLTFLHETGCRPKEARQLEARHLNDRCVILPAEEAKGKREPRVIHLTDRAYIIFRRLAMKHPKGPIFRLQSGLWTAQLLSYRCKQLSKKLGFHFTPYSLRHSFITNAILQGVDITTLAVLAGHSDIKMISRVYSHLQKRDSHLQEALRRATA